MTSWTAEFDAGDVGWLLIMAILPAVFMTSGIALALAPRLRSNELDVVWDRFPLLIASLMMAWGLWVYSLAFGPSWGTVPDPGSAEGLPMRSLQDILQTEGIHEDKSVAFGRGGIIGGLDFVAMHEVFPVATTNGVQFPVRRPQTHVPHILECLFRWSSLFVAIVPLWVVWSRRFQGLWLGLVGVLWSTFVFAPTAHWVWGDGWLEKLGTVDFGGGLLAIAVACSAVASNRGAPAGEAEFDLAGRGLAAVLLWIGASLFISAQAFHADGRAALVLLNVLLGTSAGILVWSGSNSFVWKVDGQHALGAGLAACVAGMASPAGFVQPQSAIIIGAFIGFLANAWFQLRTRKQSAKRALFFSTFGFGAAAGMLSAGVFATTSAAGARWDGRPITGLIEGNATQFVRQLAGVFSVAVWAFLGSWLLYLLLEKCQRTFELRSRNKVT